MQIIEPSLRLARDCVSASVDKIGMSLLRSDTIPRWMMTSRDRAYRPVMDTANATLPYDSTGFAWHHTWKMSWWRTCNGCAFIN